VNFGTLTLMEMDCK